ncbi:MAG: ferrochelatase [Nitrospinaceae bacterium]|jgi:ferrochelatase|nr:ferrochelatase [Nitrospinaceae bacterium]
MSESFQSTGKTAVILMAHGAPTCVDDIPLYLKNIRSGTESSPEVIQIIRDRYEAIGGSSPLLEITTRQAAELEKFLNQDGGNFKVYIGMRNWSPYIRDAVKQMVADGVKRVLAMCLAPQYSTWSTKLYFNALNNALDEHSAGSLPVQFIGTWANQPSLIDAFVDRYDSAMEKMRAQGHDKVHTIFTVHSIPAESLEYGDFYDEEYDSTVKAIVERVKPFRWYQAYQSQGMIPVPWLGPTVEDTLDRIARFGSKPVLIVPVGFVCDHIEILYDIDIEFTKHAESKKLKLFRTESLNHSPLFIEALASVVWEHLV